MGEIMCVQHRTGSCALKRKRDAKGSANSVETVCDHFVILPGTFFTGEPSCPECVAKLNKRHPELRSASVF